MDKLLEELRKTFGDNLLCVLQYGSSTRGNANTDIDLAVILKIKDLISNKDLSALKDVNQKFLDFNLDLQLFYSEEIFSGDYFAVYNHGNFIIEILQKAKVLYGENPVNKLQLKSQQKWTSIFNQNQLYVYRSRQEFLGLGRPSKDQNPDYHRKKIRYMMSHILLALGEYYPADSSLVDIFKSKYPNVLSEEEWVLITNTTALSIEQASSIYEKIYTLTIDVIKTLEDKVKLKRLNHEGMIVEFAHVDTSKAVILLDGLPSVPDQKYIIGELAKRGYSVFFPRYTGTWESMGSFLEHSPALEIDKFITKLIEGFEFNGQEIKAEEIHVLSTSFGGAVGLSISDKDKIKSIISLSPVTDFQKIVSMPDLGKYLKNVFPGAYRFTDENWSKLSRGDLMAPHKLSYENTSKHFVIGGSKDQEVTIEQLESFTKANNMKLKVYNGAPHLSFSKLKDELLIDVLIFMNR